MFQPLAVLLNRGIRASSDATRRCRALEGRSFRLELDGLGLGLTLHSTGDTVALADEARAGAPAGATADAAPGATPDATLVGSPGALARLAATGDETLLRSRAVRITGDPLVARDFGELISLAAPDFEEELSRIVGDVAARQAGKLFRGLRDWGMDSADRLSRTLAEYLQEESRDLPTRHEVDAFLDEVDTVASDTARLEARIRRLEQDE